VVHRYADRVQLIQQQNGGNASARNRGVSAAKGEWIAVLDADDKWDPTKLQKQLGHRGDADVLYTAIFNFGDTSRVGQVTFEDGNCPSGDVFEELIGTNFIAHSSAVIRTDLMRRVGGYDETLRSICDWDLFLRLSAAGARFTGCREPLTHYRWRATSVSRDHEQTRKNRLAVVTRALNSPRGRLISNSRQRQVLASAWRTSAWFAAERDRWTALRWYAKALAIWPFTIAAWRDLVRAAFHLVGIDRERLTGQLRRTRP
jgi:glycosyltransferase involved in cell wall biosynthesis